MSTPDDSTVETVAVNGVRVSPATKQRLRVYAFVTEQTNSEVIEQALVVFLDTHKVIVSVDGEEAGNVPSGGE